MVSSHPTPRVCHPATWANAVNHSRAFADREGIFDGAQGDIAGCAYPCRQPHTGTQDFADPDADSDGHVCAHIDTVTDSKAGKLKHVFSHTDAIADPNIQSVSQIYSHINAILDPEANEDYYSQAHIDAIAGADANEGGQAYAIDYSQPDAYLYADRYANCHTDAAAHARWHLSQSPGAYLDVPLHLGAAC